MTLHVPVENALALVEQPWLDRPAKALQGAIQSAYEAGGPAGRTLKNFLHGVWLGHPLHPVITDVPVGAWTAALALDTLEVTTGQRAFGAAAEVGVGLGVVSALAAAVSGLTDWQHVGGKARRVGLIHGISNIIATSLFGASWLLRRQRKRGAGRQFGLLGYLVAMLGAYLGGHMVFAQRIGVNHTSDEANPQEFTPVLPVAELADGRLRKVEVRGVPLLLVKRGDRLYALAETCAHLGGPLSEGWLVEDSVVCPWHQSRYRLEDGRVLDGPSTYDQPCFETRVRNGQVEVRAARRERQTV
jgi:nitrite reductase/ring-hydroxylating ferredoxin subunit/uncharacterized membrane protein